MPKLDLEVKGLDELQALFDKWPERTSQGLRAAVKGITALVRAKVAKYPKETAANRPPGINNYSWYKRGYGTKTVTGKAYPTSETLGRSWTTEVKGFGANVKGIVGTRASYAPFVQDEDRQAAFHKRRGWPTVQSALRDSVGEIQNLANDILNWIGR